MSFLLLLDIAKSLLLARLKQSVVAAIGVTFGIGMFISMIGFMTGLNKLMDDLILNRTPHILIYNEVKANKWQPIQISEEHHQDYNFIRSIKPKDASQDNLKTRELAFCAKWGKEPLTLSRRIGGYYSFSTPGRIYSYACI